MPGCVFFETGDFLVFYAGIHHLTSQLDRYCRDFCSVPASVENKIWLSFLNQG